MCLPLFNLVYVYVSQSHQLTLWYKLLTYECTNPARHDGATFKQHVLFHFKQAMIYTRHYHDIWMLYIDKLQELRIFNNELATSIYKEFQHAIPYTILTPLIVADYMEKQHKLAEVKAIYDSLITERAKEKQYHILIPAKYSSSAQQQSQQAQGAQLVKVEQAEGAEGKEEWVDPYQGATYKVHPLIFIQYMRFCRRYPNFESTKAGAALAQKETATSVYAYTYVLHALNLQHLAVYAHCMYVRAADVYI